MALAREGKELNIKNVRACNYKVILSKIKGLTQLT